MLLSLILFLPPLPTFFPILNNAYMIQCVVRVSRSNSSPIVRSYHAIMSCGGGHIVSHGIYRRTGMGRTLPILFDESRHTRLSTAAFRWQRKVVERRLFLRGTDAQNRRSSDARAIAALITAAS